MRTTALVAAICVLSFHLQSICSGITEKLPENARHSALQMTSHLCFVHLRSHRGRQAPLLGVPVLLQGGAAAAAQQERRLPPQRLGVEQRGTADDRSRRCIAAACTAAA